MQFFVNSYNDDAVVVNPCQIVGLYFSKLMKKQNKMVSIFRGPEIIAMENRLRNLYINNIKQRK